MTASQLADRLDESPANCSWHLRKLAEHDFIEEAEGGTGPPAAVADAATIGLELGRGRRRHHRGAARRRGAEPA